MCLRMHATPVLGSPQGGEQPFEPTLDFLSEDHLGYVKPAAIPGTEQLTMQDRCTGSTLPQRINGNFHAKPVGWLLGLALAVGIGAEGEKAGAGFACVRARTGSFIPRVSVSPCLSLPDLSPPPDR